MNTLVAGLENIELTELVDRMLRSAGYPGWPMLGSIKPANEEISCVY